MTKYFSPSTKGFYCSDVHKTMPDDVKQLSDQQWNDVAVNYPGGTYLDEDEYGNPIRVPYPTQNPTVVKAKDVRKERDAALLTTDGIVERHRDQKELGGITSLTEEQYHELLMYRQQLRDLPTQPGFPNILVPAAPSFLIIT